MSLIELSFLNCISDTLHDPQKEIRIASLWCLINLTFDNRVQARIAVRNHRIYDSIRLVKEDSEYDVRDRASTLLGQLLCC